VARLLSPAFQTGLLERTSAQEGDLLLFGAGARETVQSALRQFESHRAGHVGPGLDPHLPAV
jgi:hypothetical protein